MTEPSHDELQPGVVLQQRYEVVRRIGEGGFGEVYLANHLKFRQRVAVKKLRAAVAIDSVREQFEKEAALLFGLSHPGLPKVIDAFSQSDGEFLVMEYVEGQNFAELLTDHRGPVDVGCVLEWADQILDALEYLHTRRPPVIHRDIKPENVKLRSDGRVVLLDFGLAKGASGLRWSSTVPEVAPSADGDGPFDSASRSIAALSMGFSPLEQMVEQPTDERSDIYSLAATLYAMLTYQIPEHAVSRGAATAMGHPDPLEPIRVSNAKVPEAVEQVILNGLAIRREDRPVSASTFRAALRRATAPKSRHGESGAVPLVTSPFYAPTVAEGPYYARPASVSRTLLAPMQSATGMPARRASASKPIIFTLSVLGLATIAWISRWTVGPQPSDISVAVSPSSSQQAANVRKTAVNAVTNAATNAVPTGKVGELPADFPKDIPVYTSATVMAGSTNAMGKGASFSTADAADKVAEYYKAELPKQGWADVKSTAAGPVTSITASKDKRMLAIGLTKGRDGKTVIAVAETAKP